MVEKTRDWGETKNPADTDRASIVGVVPLTNISLNPEERLRLESGNYKALPKYIGIKSTMEMFGQYHTITLRRKNNKDYLLGGFLRFCIAVELGWEEIGAKTYFDLSDYEATIIEITENTNRIDFTSYEVIMAIGKAKEQWEQLHPATKRGNYDRSRSKNEIISDGETLMQLQNHHDISGFAEENYYILGISKRTLYRRVQLYTAIKNNIFDKRTINSFKNEKITYSQLLNKLRKIENKSKIRNKLEASKTFQLELPSPSNKQKRIIEEKSIPKDSPNLLPDLENKLDNDSLKNLEKVEKIYGAGKNNSHIEAQLKNVKKQEKSSEKGLENTQKIKQVNKSIIEGIVNKFEETGIIYGEKRNKFNIEAQDDSKNIRTSKNKIFRSNSNSIKNMYICKRCPKATVMAVESKCEECGHINFTSTVLCDDDIINGFHKLRNPNSSFCEKSPDYDLILKKVL